MNGMGKDAPTSNAVVVATLSAIKIREKAVSQRINQVRRDLIQSQVL